MIGQLIEGEYRVLDPLGEGGFGVVYRCEEIALKRIVAIKVLHVDRLSERETAAFLHEAQTLASINHPNVVQIHRLGTADGQPFIVMEYLEGETLRDLQAAGRPPLKRILEIMQQAAAGLDAIHAKGVVHRDLSPNNIMVTRSGITKILDFGLAKKLDGRSTLRRTSSILGTAPYLSPEQVEGGTVSAASDTFSFGVVLYELVAGRHPFQAEHPVSVLYNVISRNPEPLATAVPECPAGLSDLVARCLEKRPADRPGTLGDVVKALAGVPAAPEAAGTAPPQPAARRPHALLQNPYLNRVMIKRPADFFGRRNEIKRIYARLSASPPGSISVVGERKIGKSSLLNYVYAPENRAAHMAEPDKLILLFIDLQEQKTMSVEPFVRMVLGLAGYELQGRLSLADCAPTLDGMKEMVQRIDQAGFRLAFLLDEFEAITANPNFSLEFFSFLRFLANHYNVAYVTSSSKDLQTFCHAKEISDSPFFNIFSTLYLPLLTPEEARELVLLPSRAVDRSLDKNTDDILEMAGRFPFFLQVACCHGVEYLDDHPLRAELDVPEVRRRFHDEALPHFRHIWDLFDTHERSAMLHIADRARLPASLDHVVKGLARRGYVVTGGERPEPFSAGFREFVRTDAQQRGQGSWLGRLLPARKAGPVRPK